MDPDLFKAFYEEFYREINRLRTAEYGSAEAKRSELDRVERRIRRIIELITEDDAPVRALKQELVTLEARQLNIAAGACRNRGAGAADPSQSRRSLSPAGRAAARRLERSGDAR